MIMAFMSPGPLEILLILLVILLLFGAKRLPDLARSLGKSMSEFKRGRDEKDPEEIKKPARQVREVSGDED